MSVYEIKIKGAVLMYELGEITKEEAGKIIVNQLLDLEFENSKEYKKILEKKRVDKNINLGLSLISL